MELNFLILDANSELDIGYCREIMGLDGEVRSDENSSFHKLELKQFVFAKQFKEYLCQHKESISRLVYICIIDKNKQTIGRYSFSIDDDIYNHKIGFHEEPTDICWSGLLDEVISDFEIQIWNQWKVSSPSKKGEWAKLSEDGRRAWLKVVKNYNFTKPLECSEKPKLETTYYLDGTYVTDYPSFFCAIGEAVNGPGGYYGFDISSLIDCLHGGFGADTPFILIWKNHQIARAHLDTQSWIKEIQYKRIINDKLFEQPEFEELGDRPLFEALIEVIKDQGVFILFE